METNVIMKKLQKNLAEAMKAKDSARVSTLRMLLSSLKNAEKELREELPAEKELAVLSSYARRCRESIKEFEKGGGTISSPRNRPSSRSSNPTCPSSWERRM